MVCGQKYIRSIGSCLFVGWLDQQVDGVKEEAFSANMNRTRKSQWAKYRQFTEKWGLNYLPVTPINACRFMYECAGHLCYSSINNYLSGLNVLSKLNGGEDLRKDFGVSLMLKGLQRILGSEVTPKAPLLPEDLIAIFQEVNLSDRLELSVWVGVVFCFRSLLRKSHIFPTKDNDDHLLARHNIQHFEWGLLVTVPTSKTNQFKQRKFESPLVRGEGDLCVVSLLTRYWDSQNLSDDFPIICKDDGSPIMYEFALKKLKKWCTRAGLKKDIGFHSLRRGAATYMSIQGMSLHDIKVEGDWQSLSVLLYLASPLEQRKRIDKALVDSFPTSIG